MNYDGKTKLEELRDEANRLLEEYEKLCSEKDDKLNDIDKRIKKLKSFGMKKMCIALFQGFLGIFAILGLILLLKNVVFFKLLTGFMQMTLLENVELISSLLTALVTLPVFAFGTSKFIGYTNEYMKNMEIRLDGLMDEEDRYNNMIDDTYNKYNEVCREINLIENREVSIENDILVVSDEKVESKPLVKKLVREEK